MGREEAAGVADTAQPGTPLRGRCGTSTPAAPWPVAWPLFLFIGIALIDLAVYRAALNGPFLSDDIGYIVSSPYTRDLSLESVLALFDPFGAANFYTANYAPIHLLLTAVERNIFAGNFLGYHVVNILAHALNSVLLVALLRRSRLPGAVALAGGLFFALQPANVEAVAWISQLKTNGSLAFSLGALLAFERRPALATMLFTLALLTKASAAFALPVAATWLWVRPATRGASRAGPWIVGWAAIFCLYAIPQFAFFGATGGVDVPAYSDVFVHLRTIASLGARYVLMALTGIGVSAFQEPDPASSALDFWWLASLPLAACAVWRLAIVARRRSEELGYWVAAIASFAPVSQVFPFLIPFADRYLYFILPGLIGVASCMLVELYERSRRPTVLRWGAVLALGSLLIWFGAVSSSRANLWTNETLLLLDAAKHYPDGGTAAFMAARGAAQRGDAATAVDFLRKAAERGVDQFTAVAADPGLAPIRGTPVFNEFLRELAALSIERTSEYANATAPQLRMAARAHVIREEFLEAATLLERALELGGPFRSAIEADLAEVRAELRLRSGRERSRDREGSSHRPQEP